MGFLSLSFPRIYFSNLSHQFKGSFRVRPLVSSPYIKLHTSCVRSKRNCNVSCLISIVVFHSFGGECRDVTILISPTPFGIGIVTS